MCFTLAPALLAEVVPEVQRGAFVAIHTALASLGAAAAPIVMGRIVQMYGSQSLRASAEFDYIVIGAGSAGCSVAARLAEAGNVSVALLEAGPHDHHYVWTPIALASTVPKAGPRNYGYYSVPQPGLDGRRSYQPRGKGLGGTSSINSMVYIRGHRNDYDRWARLGCAGWS